jgi:hypothetical protein
MMNDWQEINNEKEENNYDFLKYLGQIIHDVHSKNLSKDILDSVKVY